MRRSATASSTSSPSQRANTCSSAALVLVEILEEHANRVGVSDSSHVGVELEERAVGDQQLVDQADLGRSFQHARRSVGIDAQNLGGRIRQVVVVLDRRRDPEHSFGAQPGPHGTHTELHLAAFSVERGDAGEAGLVVPEHAHVRARDVERAPIGKGLCSVRAVGVEDVQCFVPNHPAIIGSHHSANLAARSGDREPCADARRDQLGSLRGLRAIDPLGRRRNDA